MSNVAQPTGSRRWPWLVWTAVVLGLVPTMALAARNRSFGEDPLFIPVAVMMILGYTTSGTILATRTRRNPIAWLLVSVGALFAIVGASDEYLQYAEATGRTGSTGVALLALLTTLLWLPMLGIVSVLLLLFPTGDVPGPRWRPLPWVIAGAIALFLIGTVLEPGPLPSEDTGITRQIDNPTGVAALDAVAPVLAAVGSFVGLACIPLALAGVLLRFRRSSGDERQQLRWLAYVVTLIAVLVVAQIVAAALFGDAYEASIVPDILFISSFAALGVGIPLATGVAVLRYRLYDLDLVVKKTVVFGVLVVLVMVASLAALFAISSPLTDIAPDETQAVGIAMFLVGLSVWPLWRVARRIADRIVYGGRATPYEVLTQFSSRVGETYATDDVLPRMAQLLGQATGAEVARVWIRVGSELRPAATWPHDAPAPAVTPDDVDLDDARRAPGFAEVRHAGDALGALSIEMPANDPIGPAKERIVRDLAAQAGPVLRNVRLIEELRASRQRLVAAQDEERRKLERNLHDGAQQQLVALAVQLRLVRTLVDRDPAKAGAMLEALQGSASGALEDLRDLARGIYPPLLADKGLAAALEAQARKAPVPVRIEPDGIGRYPQEVESAVYFSCLEALNNVAKYADATSAVVTLGERDGVLTFSVTDDGRGFDTTATGYGTGLQGIADRLDAIGGRIDVRSTPGSGTSVSGYVATAKEAS